MAWLINAAQLDKFRKNQKNLIILDASFHHGDRNAKQEFLDKHIIDAQFFDIDLFSDPDPKAPHSHMLIHDEQRISELVSSLGIRNDYKIIFYDNSDLHTACRALWQFKMFGHNSNLLYVLDGGLKSWEKFGGKTESGQPTVTPKPYKAQFTPEYLRTLTQVKANLIHPSEQIVDVRHAVRYTGGKEARTGVRAGHIPGSYSFPTASMFDKEGHFLPIEKLRKKCIEIGISLNAPIITSCGSGMTAPIFNFILDLMNYPQHAVYNGSWTEWGAEKLFEGETSLDERPVESCIE